MDRFAECFSPLVDPRKNQAQHDLTEMLFIALLATLCGATTCCDIALFGRSKEALLRTILRAGTRDTEPRHLQPCLSHPRSAQLRRGFSALHQGVCDGGQNQGRGSSRWQGTEKSLRTRPKSHAASDGDGVERNDPHGARQCAGAWKQRSGRRFASRRASSAERLRRHGGCAALSSRDGESHRGARWRLRLGGKEQPARFAARCQGRDLRGRAQEGQTSHRPGTPVTAARKPEPRSWRRSGIWPKSTTFRVSRPSRGSPANVDATKPSSATSF